MVQYNNGYYPYYNNGYSQPQQQYYNQPQQQPIYLPLTFVNGIIGAQATLVGVNQKIYMLDSDNPILYEKSADAHGRTSIIAYQLTKVPLDKVGTETQPSVASVTKDDIQIISSKLDNLLELMKPTEVSK